MDDQNIDIFDGADPDAIPGSNPADGWSEAGGSNSERLTEAFIAGSTTIEAVPIPMGNLFNVGGNQNLVFRYREPSRLGFLRTGIVEYFSDVSAISAPEPCTCLLGLMGFATLLLIRNST